MSRTVSVGLASMLWALSVALGFGAGCGDDSHDHGDQGHDGGDHGHGHDAVGDPSGATCPSNSTLTYENFAEDFFASYCLRCHSSKVSGNARMGAPGDHDFDTYAEIELMAEHIDQLAAFGEDSENDAMPPSGAKPTDEERRKLGEWIACGLKE